jgi:uncharacterized membrane protein YphA (DoxX/SURF4 family)
LPPHFRRPCGEPSDGANSSGRLAAALPGGPVVKWEEILHTRASPATILIRLMVGAVFLSEGLQKFIFPEQLGSGRFESIGFPAAHLLGPLVGCFEVACGTLVLLGLATRLAAIPLVVIMLTAIVATKLPILLGGGLGPFRAPGSRSTGFWAMAHEARVDGSMLLGSAFLCLVGGGPWSLDARLARRRPSASPAAAGRP